MAAVQVSRFSTFAVLLMVAVYFTAVSAQAPAPSPVPDKGAAGYAMGASGAVICSSLLLSIAALLRN
ncbi:hypothetical protein LINPERPRIM_LOCUS39529 [Linum perenne]